MDHLAVVALDDDAGEVCGDGVEGYDEAGPGWVPEEEEEQASMSQWAASPAGECTCRAFSPWSPFWTLT